MLGKIFNTTPLWQHTDPAQRLIGIGELPPNAQELFSLLDDPVVQVRTAALQRIDDLTRLSEQLADRAGDTALRERTIALLAHAPVDAHEHVLARLGDEVEMARLAASAPTNSLRMAAAQRVHSIALLRELAETVRDKDHGVARYVKERLDTLDTQAGRETNANEICAALEGLLGESGPVVTKVVELDRRYAALQPDAPAAERYHAARTALAQRFEREQDQQRERNAWVKDFNALKTTEQTADMSQATLDATRAQYADLESRAQSHPDLLSRLHGSGALHAIALLENTLAAQAQADALLHDFAPAIEEAGRLVEFEDRWNAIPAEGRDPQRQQRFEDLLGGHRRQLQQVVAADAAQQAQARQKLHTLLATAEESLAAGEIQKAAAARDEMKPLRALAGELPKPTNQRLGRLSQQLGDLLRWQAFGNATQREEMCSQAEGIPQLALPVGELAKRVQALRDQWKQLDQTQAPAPRALWERFNAACEVAYAPAAEHFSKQAEQRKEALQRREAAIKEMSDYAALALTAAPEAPDWTPDWKAIAAHLAKADANWRTLGHVDRRKIEAVEAKWNEATKPLRDGINGVRSEETHERERLIAQVKALFGEDGKLAAGAVAQVKTAQATWQSHAKAFPLPRKLEQSLWETFRASCNAVFDALGAEKTARNTAFAKGVAERTALIDQYAALAQGHDEKAIRLAIADAPKQWAKLADAGRENERRLADRFDKTLRQLRDALRSSEKAKGALQVESLEGAAQACGMLETAALAGTVPTAQLSSDQIAKFDALPPAWKQKMASRRQAAERALADAGAAAALRAQVDRARAQADQQLRELELELNVATPHMSAQQRMQMQVARLANRMKSGSTSTPLERFVDICALASAPDPELGARLHAVLVALASQAKAR